MHEDITKRLLAGKFECGEDHARYPEVNDVIACNQNIVRVKTLIVAAVLIRPAECSEWPQIGAEPGIENVLILLQIIKTADFAGFIDGIRYKHFTRRLRVPGRDAVPPPQLAGNTPVAYIFDPVQIGFLKTVRHEVHAFAILLCSDGGFGQRLHLNEPLGGQIRLNHCAGTLAVSYLVHMVLNGDQNTLLLQISNDILAAFAAVLTLVRSGFLIHRAAFVHHINLRQVMAKTYLEVVRIMGRGDLHRTAAEFLLYIIIGNNRNLTADDRQNQSFADQVFIAFILRMHRYRCIAQHRLRTRSRYRNEAAAVLKRITQVVQMSVNFLIFYFDI
ncbi:hypothetical protein D3C75_646080 [compost metagenome]